MQVFNIEMHNQIVGRGIVGDVRKGIVQHFKGDPFLAELSG